MRKLLKLISIFFLKGFGASSLLLLNFYIAKMFPIVVSGEFFWFFSLMIILSQVLSFGANDYILKKFSVSNVKDDIANDAGNTIKFIILCFFGLVLLFYLIYLYSEDEFYFLISIFMIGSGFLVISNLCSYIFQGCSNHEKSVYFLNIGPYIIGCILLFLTEIKSLHTLSLMIICGIGLNAIISVVLCVKSKLVVFDFRIQYRFILNFIKDIKWYWLICGSSVLMNWGAIFYSGYILNEREVSLLNVSLRISMLLNFLLITVNVLVAPKIAYLFNENRIKDLQVLVSNTLSLLYFLTVPCSLALIYFSKDLLFYVNENFEGEHNLLILLCVGQLFNVLTGPSGYLLSMTGQEKIMANIYFINAIIFTTLVLCIGWGLGIYGVAIAVIISMILFNLSIAFYVNYHVGIKLLPILNILKSKAW